MIQTGSGAMADQAHFRYPLDGYGAAFSALTTLGLSVAVVPQPAQINLRGQSSDLTAAVVEACGGLALAARVNDATANGTWHCLGLGPDEWLLVGPMDTGPEVAAAPHRQTVRAPRFRRRGVLKPGSSRHLWAHRASALRITHEF